MQRIKSLHVILALAVVVIAILTVRLFHKETINKLFSPGPLTAFHEKYENDCFRCHRAFEKEGQNELCLSCHKEVGEDLENSQGFHGRISLGEKKFCKACHTEHRGKDYSIVSLDRETFNHAMTDFRLEGAHARVSVTCDGCHPEGKKFRQANRDCLACHASDDRHQGQLGTLCSDCHKQTHWKETYFDHKKTRFPLEGKHREVACHACHANALYKNTPTDCIACHLINNVHGDSVDCRQCHGFDGWKDISYDHGRMTKFMLKDRHAQVACVACHPGNAFNNYKTQPACFDCHKSDDIHKGKNGIKCESCHSSSGWQRITFDHDRDTHFKLEGRHQELPCATCHKESKGNLKIDTSCVSCHRKDDIHKSQLGIDCASCHRQKAWRDDISFDHDLTGFPLIGLHAVTPCGGCHLSLAFKDAGTTCRSCHLGDDSHKGTLGADCSRCHDPNGWDLWEFDHNTQTTYKLEGAHEGLECSSCHREGTNRIVPFSGSCVSCHEDDDAHQGRFGIQCDRCHTAESFKKNSREDKG